jgi:DNA-binding transcriptional LysR family regulator
VARRLLRPWSAMRDLPDDLDLLLALDVFLAERHVTRAAKRLGVSQGAASQKLARLREFFEDAILVPGKPLLVLTPRAQALVEPLSSALAALRGAVRAGAPFDPGTSVREFVLLGGDLVEVLALPQLLRVLAREAPQVSMRLERADADFAMRLERGTADLAFVPNFMTASSLMKRALPPQPFVVLLRKGHPVLRKRRQLTLEAYLELGHLLIAPHGLPGSIVDAALRALGKQRRVVARIQHFTAAPPIIASSDLAVTCPATVFTAMERWVPVVALPPPLPLPIDHSSSVWHPRSDNDLGHAWLRGLIDRALQGSPGPTDGRRGARRP